jgi:enoyl-CoA hydratase
VKVRYEAGDDGIATITLDDPATRNALSPQLLDELIAAFARARDDAQVRCVVLASSHERTFSTGADLGGMGADAALVDKHGANARFVALFQLIGALGKPSIVAAGGHVLGGALGVVLACDLIVAARSASFGTPEIGVGAFPFMVMALAYRNLPRKKVNELLLLGERIDAEQAERIGLVNRVVADDELAGAVREWALRLAARSPLILRLGKDAMHAQQDLPLGQALDYLRAQLTIAQSSDDLHEGVRAFFDRREPRWTGR